VIAFSSGTNTGPVTADQDTGGIHTAVAIGFPGSHTFPTTISGTGTLVLPAVPGGAVNNYAFNAPRSGTITAISATFVPNTGCVVPTDGSGALFVGIFHETTGVGTTFQFMSAYNASVSIVFAAAPVANVPSTASVTLITPAPVAQGDRLMIIVSAYQSTGGLPTIMLDGWVSAGICFA
jgi:hypothetical protein